MFDVAFDAVGAYNAVMLLIMGLVFSGVGAAMIGYAVYTRRAWVRVRGRIAGVREQKGGKNGTMYTAVFEYPGPDGKLIRSAAGSSSSMLSDKVPGTDVNLLVNPKDPYDVRRPGVILFIFGAFFAAPGVFLLSMALRDFEFNIYLVLIFLAIIGVMVFRVTKLLKPHDRWESPKEFIARMKEEHDEEKEERGTMLEEHEVRVRLRKHDLRVLLWSPVNFLIAIGLLVWSAYVWQDTKDFLAVAVQERGEVVRLESERDSDGDVTYRSIVSYITQEGEKIEFRDKVSSNPPSHERGDIVEVLYDPTAPEKAWIDRGVWNWTVPGALAGVGFLFIWWTLWNVSRVRRRLRRR